MPRNRKPLDDEEPEKSRGANRGRGVYFDDNEWAKLLEEVSLQNYERKRPVSNSEVVRAAVREFIERQTARREREKKKNSNGE